MKALTIFKYPKTNFARERAIAVERNRGSRMAMTMQPERK